MNVFEIALQIWKHISRKRKYGFVYLLILMILSSVSEVLSISAIFPFLAILSNQDLFFQNTYVQYILSAQTVVTKDDFLWIVTTVFCIATVLSGFVKVIQVKYNTRLAFITGSDLSREVYYKTLCQPYTSHISNKSSEIINAVVAKTNMLIFQGMLPMLNILTSLSTLLFIGAGLLYVNSSVLIILVFSFTIFYKLVGTKYKKKLKENSTLISRNSSKVISILQEGLGGIRDIIIDKNQMRYCKAYSDADVPLRLSQGENLYISNSPRYLIETIGMLLITVIAYSLASTGDSQVIVPTLGAFALASQRILPAMQSIYFSYTTINGYKDSLIDVIKLLNLNVEIPNSADVKIKYTNELTIKNVSYKHPGMAKPILYNINLEIKRGSTVGVIGKTGSGKSTLMDLMMGLLSTYNGSISIDGILLTQETIPAWHNLIAHVPQNIYLMDGTIRNNIAFCASEENIDDDLLIECASKAQLTEYISNLPEGLNTVVGENGIKLSGGQKQRIAIARALYKKPKIIFFDEATSALDDATEKLIINTIHRLGGELTIFMVAHRISTLEFCDIIYELGNGEIINVHTYESLRNKK